MITDTFLESSARRLLDARHTRTPIAPLSDSHPELSEDEAYRIQDMLLDAGGDPQVGYKLGFTSQAMRQQMGVSDPNYGRLTESMRVDSDDGPVALSEVIHPRVEAEVALLVERDLSGPGLAPETVYPAVRWAFGAIEIVDSRYQAYRFLGVDNIADNSSAARFVLSPPTLLSAASNLRLAGVLLWREGRVVDRGLGADALGDPIRAVAWLANRLGESGQTLGAGSVVLTGGLTRAYSVVEQGTFLAEFADLGTVKVHFS